MEDYLKYRLKEKMQIIDQKNGPKLALVGPVRLPAQLDDEEIIFQWHTWLSLDNLPTDKDALLESLPNANLANSQQSSVLVYGDFQHAEHSYIRFHSICHTGDIFGSKRCDCGYQLRQSMKLIKEHGSGAIFYLANHEGRGIGLFSKSLAYILQDEQIDTVEANHLLGFEDDERTYEEALHILLTLRKKPVSVITNNPKKIQSLQQFGIKVNTHIPVWGAVSEHNEKYLQTKIEKSGHIKDETTLTKVL